MNLVGWLYCFWYLVIYRAINICRQMIFRYYRSSKIHLTLFPPVTTGRKAMTIVLSFLFFAKPFTFQYIWSGLLVVLGIFLNVYSKNMDKIRLPSVYSLIKKAMDMKKSRTLAQTV